MPSGRDSFRPSWEERPLLEPLVAPVRGALCLGFATAAVAGGSERVVGILTSRSYMMRKYREQDLSVACATRFMSRCHAKSSAEATGPVWSAGNSKAPPSLEATARRACPLLFEPSDSGSVRVLDHRKKLHIL